MTIRIVKLTNKYVQKCRANNYAHHFECRKFMKMYPQDVINHYKLVCETYIQPPLLNAFGADSYDDLTWKEFIRIANSEKLQASLLISWYITDEGWAAFQKQWFELPEVTPDLLVALQMELQRKFDNLIGRDFFEDIEGDDVVSLDTRKFIRADFETQRYHLYSEIVQRDGEQCKVCGSTKDLTVDHIIPVSKGGTNDLDNLQILCRKHNSTKAKRRMK